jgi:hypothetical protein
MIAFSLHVRIILIGLIFSCWPCDFFAQEAKIQREKNREVLKKVAFLLEASEYAVDSIYDNVTAIWTNPSTDDSVRVEIAYLIRKFPHPQGLKLLIDHVEDSFSYGLGASGIDQFNTDVCIGILSALSSDKHQRWSLITPILNSLKIENRSEEFIKDLSQCLIIASNKNIAKAILEVELQENRLTIRNLRNHVYENNLLIMLKQFE